MDKQKAASYIDHTILKPAATKEEIIKLCSEAKQYHFASVCVNPVYVALAAAELQGSGVPVYTVVGFPLGASTSEAKAFEAARAVQQGAMEIDMVIHTGSVKNGDYAALEADVKAVVAATKQANAGAIVKVIIETCLLTDDEKINVCRTLLKTGAEYVKTSTGFSTGGATAADVKLMKDTVGTAMLVKASGGVRSAADFNAMVNAGASRIGTSNGIAILNEMDCI